MNLLFELESKDEQRPLALPQPRRERWQPLRGGLLNLYRYDYEEFWYEDGRLLLRGNNGTGKSRVLALQLPFLLDGEVAAHRVEPDGDPAKRMEWNLLLGKYHERTGYTWLEFGRCDADGTPRFVTIGCGLAAVEGRAQLNRWFFVTRRRVGEDLFLQAATGQPLNRERLTESLGEHGQVFVTAAEYRRAVDESLFQLGEQRYGALVDLLIQLRQPQLSRQLDEKRLSYALAEALAPLSSQILADVAESFRSLDSDRHALSDFSAAHQGTDQFLTEYRRYVQIAARRRADDVRQAHNRYDATMRRLRAAEADRDAAQQTLTELTHRLLQLELDQQGAETAVRTLEDSPQMRGARELDAAKRDSEEKLAEANRAADDHQRATREQQRLVAAEQDERKQADEFRRDLQAKATTVMQRAGQCGLEAEQRRVAHPLDASRIASAAPVSAVRQTLDEAIHRRFTAARHVRELNQKISEAAVALSTAKQLQENLASQLEEALDQQKQSHHRLAHEVNATTDAYRHWHRELVEMSAVPPDRLDSEFREWVERSDGASPLTRAVQSALNEATARLVSERAYFEQELATAEAGLTGLQAEYDRLQAGHHEPPTAPHTRDVAARSTRAGAPLWQVVDFRADLPDDARAGLEAAMEAAGLLDAWLTPDGRLLDTREHDTFVIAGSNSAVHDGKSLADVLAPAVARTDPRVAELTDETVAAVLGCIGLGRDAGPTWVDFDGRWRMGPLHGAWYKRAAEHIGETARETARRQRLEILACEIEIAESEVAAVREEVIRLEQQTRAMQDEAARAPSDELVRQTLAAISEKQRIVNDLRGRVAEKDGIVALRRRQYDESVTTRDLSARDLQVERWAANPQELEDALTAYRQSLFEWWPAIRDFVGQRDRAALAAAAATEAGSEAQRRAEVLHDAQRRAEAAASRFDTLFGAIGAAVEEIQQRLETARRQVEQLKRDWRSQDDERTKAKVSEALACERVKTANDELQRNTDEREAAVTHLKRFAVTRLLTIAMPDLEAEDSATWSITRSVDLARAVEASLGEVASDDAAWERSQKTIHKHIEELKTALTRYGYEPEAVLEDSVFVVTVPFQGRSCTMSELRAALADEITSRQELLNAREREVLENHLIGEVATHLHELLHLAERWVENVNRELAERPMSTGMKLRFVWRPADEGPAGVAEARKRLLRADGTWSPGDREALGRFLQEQIQNVRAANVVGTWQEHLTQALDYRRWHTFDIERHQDGQWRRLTRRTHGTGSGGEKAIALTIPQFAAAAAHYSSADKLAPRLILLDEAFVGIDADMRSKCMGLLHAFDLDFAMTSEREWGCYATLPALAIYQLASRQGIDAVHVTRWIWNGVECLRSPHALPQAAGPNESRESGNVDLKRRKPK